MSNPLDDLVEASGVEILGAAQRRRVQERAVAGNLQRVAAGIPDTSIAAGATATLTTNISEPFRPDRIVLDSASQALNVLNISIGTKALNVSDQPIAGDCFAPDAVGTHLQGYTAQQGVGFKIQFENPTAGALTPRGGVFGPGIN